MPVRIKITLLFSAIVFCILGLIYTSIYFFAANSRANYIQTRLTNMAITTGNFLSREETFSREIINKIDSLTTISFTRKTAQVYDQSNKKIYSFNDNDEDTLFFSPDEIIKTRTQKIKYSEKDKRDVVFYHYTDDKNDLVIIAAGYDLYGHQNLKSLEFILLISFFTGVMIAVLSGYIFSKKIMKPLGIIADEVNEISVQNLAKRIETGPGRDEWNYLSITLNKLLNRLQESFELQSRFISNASHELSTPLTSISSQLEIALQKDRSPEENRKVMDSIYQDIQQMVKLTRILLEMASASGSRSGLEIKSVRIDEIVLRIPLGISKVNQNYSVVIDFNEPPENQDYLIVNGNEELLYTAINNIVVNACKYSQNHEAKIILKADAKNINVLISNKEVGIPANEIENIFQPFYRVETNHSRSGFGLGLSLAKKIINLHEGNIKVDSSKINETIFSIEFIH